MVEWRFHQENTECCCLWEQVTVLTSIVCLGISRLGIWEGSVFRIFFFVCFRRFLLSTMGCSKMTEFYFRKHHIIIPTVDKFYLRGNILIELFVSIVSIILFLTCLTAATNFSVLLILSYKTRSCMPTWRNIFILDRSFCYSNNFYSHPSL